MKIEKFLEYDSSDTEKWESYRALTPETISGLVSHTGLPEEFIGGLEDGDDWSFAIKIHSLIEWALNKLVVDAIRDERLAKVISRLDTSDKLRGKMAFVKALELLPAEARGFVSILSELRNDLVHNAASFVFSFSSWVSNMSPEAFKNFTNALNFGFEGPIADEKWPPEERKLMRTFPSRLLRSLVMDRALTITALAVTKD